MLYQQIMLSSSQTLQNIEVAVLIHLTGVKVQFIDFNSLPCWLQLIEDRKAVEENPDIPNIR